MLRNVCTFCMVIVLSVGCGKSDKDPERKKRGDDDKSTKNKSDPGLMGEKYYPDLQERITKAGYKSSQMLLECNEEQLIKILGEPTKRGPSEQYDNRLGKYEKYELQWLRAKGEDPAIRAEIKRTPDGRTRITSYGTNLK